MNLTSKRNYLFVYGTLRKEFGLQLSKEIQQDVAYIGNGIINGKMYDIGEYPAALPSTNINSKIVGEIYELKKPMKILRLLDKYEGNDRKNLSLSEYYRKKMLEMASGEMVQAWIYWYGLPVTNKRKINQTDYLQYLKKKTA